MLLCDCILFLRLCGICFGPPGRTIYQGQTTRDTRRANWQLNREKGEKNLIKIDHGNNCTWCKEGRTRRRWLRLSAKKGRKTSRKREADARAPNAAAAAKCCPAATHTAHTKRERGERAGMEKKVESSRVRDQLQDCQKLWKLKNKVKQICALSKNVAKAAAHRKPSISWAQRGMEGGDEKEHGQEEH